MSTPGSKRDDGKRELDLRERVGIGRAADLAGVTYAEIHGRIAAGELPSESFQRLGTSIPLVRVGDLVRLYPAIVGGRDITEELSAIDAEEEWKRGVGDRLSELEQQVAHERGINEELVEKVAALQTLIADYRDEIRALLAARKRDSVALRDATQVQKRLMREGPLADRPGRRAARVGLILLGMTLILAATLGVGFLWSEPTTAQAAETVLITPTPEVEEPHILNNDALRDFEQEQADEATPRLVTPAEAAPRAVQQPPAAEPEEPVAAAYVEQPCFYYPLTKPGEELRSVLGPCLGTWSHELDAPVGAHRLHGKAVCSQHRFVVTSLGGSLEDARRDAAFAREQGLLPPLVRIRVHRRAVDFMKRQVPNWLESGLEGLSQGEHRLAGLEQDDTYALESWVTFEDPDEGTLKRDFVMELRVNEGPGGDTLIRFDWKQDAR